MKLIKLQDKFILVSDEEIQIGDKSILIVEDFEPIILTHFENVEKGYIGKKIIAGAPELPSIDFSLLSEEDCKTIGWVDVDKLAEYHWKMQYMMALDDSIKPYIINDFITGFKTAQSLNDNTDLIFNWLGKNDYLSDDVNTLKNEYIQSLQQTSWGVEVEMEEKCWCMKPQSGGCAECIKKPKITNNSIKVLRICG